MELFAESALQMLTLLRVKHLISSVAGRDVTSSSLSLQGCNPTAVKQALLWENPEIGPAITEWGSFVIDPQLQREYPGNIINVRGYKCTSRGTSVYASLILTLFA